MAGQSLPLYPGISSNDTAYLRKARFVVEVSNGVKVAEYKVKDPTLRQVAVTWLGGAGTNTNRQSVRVLSETDFWSPIRELEIRRFVRGGFPRGERTIVTPGGEWSPP